MVNITLQHCKSYLLNLICRCVSVWVCVRIGKGLKKQKQLQSDTLLKHFTQVYLILCDT